jgi:hypothetical protein
LNGDGQQVIRRELAAATRRFSSSAVEEVLLPSNSTLDDGDVASLGKAGAAARLLGCRRGGPQGVCHKGGLQGQGPNHQWLSQSGLHARRSRQRQSWARVDGDGGLVLDSVRCWRGWRRETVGARVDEGISNRQGHGSSGHRLGAASQDIHREDWLTQRPDEGNVVDQPHRGRDEIGHQEALAARGSILLAQREAEGGALAGRADNQDIKVPKPKLDLDTFWLG